MKWDMGWMHDTLQHFEREPIHRKYHYGELTFRGLYAFTERFVLPLSHDEVVHGKGALVTKMPGDDWQRRATLRLLYAHQWFQPGKKLLFMGDELATWREWNHEDQLEWDLLRVPGPRRRGPSRSQLNRLYAELEPLREGTSTRRASNGSSPTIPTTTCSPGAAPGTTASRRRPQLHPHPPLRLPGGPAERRANGASSATPMPSNTAASGVGNLGAVLAEPVPSHGRPRASPSHCRRSEPSSSPRRLWPAEKRGSPLSDVSRRCPR